MELGIRGKVAFVTGAGQGIGEAIAMALAAEGARVAVNDLDADRARAVSDRIAATGEQAIPAAADVTSSGQITEAIGICEESLGPVDILVNNAAYLLQRRFVESDREDWVKTIDTCLIGTMVCAKAVLTSMIERQQGNIISVASDAARVGQEFNTFYCAAKGGIIAFSKSLAKEVGPRNINVNCISPSATDTPMFRSAQQAALERLGPNLFEERRKKLLAAYPLRRIGTPNDVANTVVFLASNAARHITGQTLSVNGGFTML